VAQGKGERLTLRPIVSRAKQLVGAGQTVLTLFEQIGGLVLVEINVGIVAGGLSERGVKAELHGGLNRHTVESCLGQET